MKSNIDQDILLKARKTFGSQVRDIRKKKKLSQQNLADLVGTSRSTISKIEDGRWSFGIDTMIVLGIHLGFTLKISTK